MNFSTLWSRKVAGVLALVASGSLIAAEPAPGTMINAENVDQYKEYLAPSMVLRIKQGELLKVFPYTPIEELVYPKWLEMTRNPPKGPAVMLDEAGTWGLPDGSPWPGGFPFPTPKNGREVMANFFYELTQDDMDSATDPGGKEAMNILVDDKGRPFKIQELNYVQRRMTSRVWVDPIGTQPGYENELFRVSIRFFSPYDVRGLSTLNIVYRDQAKLPDSYIYVPVLRRVRRQAGSQRADGVAGSEITVGDTTTFADPMGMWDLKLVGTQRMLGGANHSEVKGAIDVKDGKAKLVGGRFCYPWCGVEMRDVYVVEGTPKYDTIYGKKMLYLDKETYRPYVGEFLDRQGKFLRVWGSYFRVRDDFTVEPLWQVITNMQTNFSTAIIVYDFKGNVNVPVDRVLPNNMQEFGR